MKIGFWSCMHGQSGATSSMIATSIYMCAMKQKKVGALQTHFSLNNLGYPLLGITEGAESFRDSGIDALLRDVKSKPLTNDIVLSDCVSLLSKQYSLFLGTGSRNKDAFEKDMRLSLNKIMNEIEQYNDYVFIDIASGYSSLSKSVAKHMDLLIVNLSQNRYVIEEYMDNPIEGKDIIYLFGNYKSDSTYNIKNLTRLYPELKKKSYCIYYNADFMDAMNDGKAVGFLLKNMSCDDLSAQYDFVQSVKSLVDAIKEKRDEIANI